jgi:hypothetical protein
VPTEATDSALNTAIDTATAAPAPEPAATAAPATSAPASAAASGQGPTTPPPSADSSATAAELASYKALGLTPAQIAEVTQRDRQVQAALQRMDEEEQRAAAATPDGQKRARQREAFRDLAREVGLDPDVLQRAVEGQRAHEAETNASRTKEARATFIEAIRDLPYDPATPDGKTAIKEVEDLVAGLIQHNDELNAAYFDPSTRASAVERAAAMVVGQINRALIASGAADLRAQAARRSAVPRTASASGLASISDAAPKWTGDRNAYLAASKKAAASAIDEMLNFQLQ